MRRVIVGLAIAAAASAAGGRVWAHHSYSATYFEDRTQKIEGHLVQFHFQNPHAFVQVEAPDDKGVMQRWVIEWAASWQLSRKGIDRDTLRPGDRVIVVGKPGRNPGDHRLHLINITRPSDGWKWAGNSE